MERGERALAEKSAAQGASRADPHDLAEPIAFALRYRGTKWVYQADEYMATIAAERIVEQLSGAGFVVLKRPPIGLHAARVRGLEV